MSIKINVKISNACLSPLPHEQNIILECLTKIYAVLSEKCEKWQITYRAVFPPNKSDFRTCHVQEHCIILNPRRLRESVDLEPILDVQRTKYRIALKTHCLHPGKVSRLSPRCPIDGRQDDRRGKWNVTWRKCKLSEIY